MVESPIDGKIRTATRSCRTRKRAFHFYSPGVVQRSHTAALHVRPAAAAAAPDAATTAAVVYSLFADLHVNCKSVTV